MKWIISEINNCSRINCYNWQELIKNIDIFGPQSSQQGQGNLGEEHSQYAPPTCRGVIYLKFKISWIFCRWVLFAQGFKFTKVLFEKISCPRFGKEVNVTVDMRLGINTCRQRARDNCQEKNVVLCSSLWPDSCSGEVQPGQLFQPSQDNDTGGRDMYSGAELYLLF